MGAEVSDMRETYEASMIARAWVEDGVIRCLSQMCETGGTVCPRLETCLVVRVTIDKV